MSTLEVVWLAVLVGALPTLSVLQARVIKGMELERIPVYRSSAVTLLVVGGVSWWLGARDLGGAGLGLVTMPPRAWVGWTVALTGLGLVGMLGVRWIAAVAGARETPALRKVLPVTRKERVAFTGLSLVAGLGEELAYRGFAISRLAPLLGVPTAAVLTSFVFGLLHAYQGRLGIVRTGLLGGVLAWGVIASGSLWPAIGAHALLDVLSGLVFGERLMVPEGLGGVATSAARDAEEDRPTNETGNGETWK